MQVTLIDSMGTDDRVVDAARVSFSKIASNYTKEQNDRLITYLANHGHYTPFTHPQITMLETVPIFVARQRYKHTIGFSYNEVSRRYVDDTPEFFIPDAWRKRADNKKQGSSNETFSAIKVTNKDGEWHLDTAENLYSYALFIAEQTYKTLLENGVAPEQARMVLPQSMMTSYYVTGSLSAWARAYKLRSEEHSQKEIQDLAAEWNKVIAPLFPVSWAALTT